MPTGAEVAQAAIDELLEVNPRYIRSLPAPTTLVCRREDDGSLLVVTTSRVVYERARALRLPTFVGTEIESLVVAAEHDRGTPSTIIAWCKRKADEPGWKLSVRAAMGEVYGEFPELKWPLKRVLWRYWLGLVEVTTGDEVPVWLGGAGALPGPATADASAGHESSPPAHGSGAAP